MTESSTESTLQQLSDEAATENQRPSLLKRVMKATAWTFSGHVASQVIRLGSNLLMSRLLFPEAFGLMALVNTVISGLYMFSDTGTNANIIQSKRGEDPAFLNTAWTVDCIRGIFLWLCTCLLSFPIARFYNEPLLLYLLPVSGITVLLTAFESNKLVLASRNLDIRRLTIIDLLVQISAITVILVGAGIAKVTGAPIHIAVWSLVAGNIAGGIVRLTLSYTFIEGEGNKFQLEPEALKEIFQFGQWIFLSTILTFFAYQGNNLIIPRLLGFSFFGIFSFASNLSLFATSIVGMVEGRVLYASYSEVHRERPERLRPILRRARIVLNAVNCAVALFFICFGQILIHIMYDERYSDAGWILQLLALGSILPLIVSTYSNVLMAQGKTHIMPLIMVLQTVAQIAGIFIGYYFGKEFGLVLGLTLSGWAIYPFAAVLYARLSLWQPEVDFPIIGIATVTAALILMF